MPFQWKEYLALARFIKDQQGPDFSNEAAIRSAVSRAYYAAFCYARAYANSKHGYVIAKSADDHRNVRDHYRGRRMNVIADKLEELRKWRDNCDYDQILDPNPHLLALALSFADYVITHLK